jgi:ferric-dicitrate binding protein FerR (iron transport regulator)
MNDRDIEKLLRSFEGPSPRGETTRRIMDAARKTAGRHDKAPAPRGMSRLRRWLPVAACIAIALTVWLLVQRRDTGPPDIMSGSLTGTVSKGAVPLGKVASDSLDVKREGKTYSLKREAALFAADELAPALRADIKLADGSTVRLDKDSRLKLHKTSEDERGRIGLESGRIFVRVAKAPGEFIVLAGAEVRVAGTAFGVSRNDRGTSVNVIEGRVVIGSVGRQIELSRGESATAQEGAPPTRTTADPNPAVAWARDATRFDNRPLTDVLDWISSNSSYRFDVPAEVASRRVSVAVADQPMREVIEAVAIACGLKSSVADHNVTMK